MATMQYELKEMRSKATTLGIQALAKHNEITSETPEARAAEITAEATRMLDERDALESRIAFAQKLADVEASLEDVDPRRPNESRSVRGSGETISASQAYEALLRAGKAENLTSEYRSALRSSASFDSLGEKRAQAAGTGSAGGYLVPIELANEIIIALKLAGPMMDPNVVRVVHTDTGATMNWPTMDDTSNQGYLIAENQQVTANAVTLGQVPIHAYKFSTGVVQFSSELAQDSAFDVASFVKDAMVVRAGRVGNQYLTTGTGASQPDGILTAIGTSAVTSNATAAISFDDILNLEHSVDPLYRTMPKTRFQFHDTTFKALRLLKDNYGRYIWEPAVQLDAEATLFGYKYSINQALPTYGTSGNQVVIFGDHDRYLTRIVKDFATRLLVERYADYDQQALIGFMRVDGALLDTSGRAL